MQQEPTTMDILEAIQSFSGHVDEQFTLIRAEFRSEIGGIKSEVGSLKSEVGSLKSEIGSIKAQMVTKSYLDDKLADLKGDMVAIVRREDQKVNRLITVLAEKEALSVPETRDVMSFKVFPS